MVSATNLTSNTGSSASSFNTASISPASNALILVSVRSNVGSTVTTPTVSGASMTWVQITATQVAGAADIIYLFRGLSASPGSGALTIDFSGQSQDQTHWIVDQLTGVDTGGTNGSGAIVQSNVNSVSSTTTISVTLSAFGSTSNATYGTIGRNAATAVTAGGSFTQLAQNATNQRAIQSEWAASPQTTVNWTTGSNTDSFGAIAAEIKARPSTGDFLPFI
jgi:hypothetical protein